MHLIEGKQSDCIHVSYRSAGWYCFSFSLGRFVSQFSERCSAGKYVPGLETRRFKAATVCTVSLKFQWLHRKRIWVAFGNSSLSWEGLQRKWNKTFPRRFVKLHVTTPFYGSNRQSFNPHNPMPPFNPSLSTCRYLSVVSYPARINKIFHPTPTPNLNVHSAKTTSRLKKL